MKKCKRTQCDVESPATGGETAQMTPREKIMYFRDILDVVINMSDEEWMSLTKDMETMLLEFAHMCSGIVISISISSMKQYVPTLIDAFGIEAFLNLDAKLKKTEAASKTSSASSAGSSDSSTRNWSQSSLVDLSDCTYESFDYFVNKVKMATQEAVCKAASFKTLSSKNWKTLYPSVAKEVLNILSGKVEGAHLLETAMTGKNELQNSLGSQLPVDSVLGALTQAEFPTDSDHSHLYCTSREIVQTIAEDMNMLSSAIECNTAEDSRLFSDINCILSTINEKMKVFFNVARHPGKENSELLSTNALPVEAHIEAENQLLMLTSSQLEGDAPPKVQCDIVSCTDEIIIGIMDLNEMQVAKPISSIICPVNQSASLQSSVESDKVSIWTSSSIAAIKTGRVLIKATQVVNDFLVGSESLQTSWSTSTQSDWDLGTGQWFPSTSCSSRDLQSVAASIAGTVVDALESLVESRVIDNNSDSTTIVSALDSFSFVSSAYNLSGSDIANVGCVSTPCSLFQRVRSYQALFMGSSQEQSPFKFASQPTAPSSALQLFKGHSLSMVNDLTVTCTDSIIREIINTHYSETSLEFDRAVGSKGSKENLVSFWEIHGIMQGLERLACSRSSSSRSSVTNRDLGGRKDISFSKIYSDFDDDIALDYSSDQVEECFSSQFQSKATQVVSDLLLTTGAKLAASTQCSMASSPLVSQTHVDSTLEEVAGTEPPSVAAPSSSTEVKPTASAIIQLFLKRVWKLSSSAQCHNASASTGPSQRNFFSASHSIYRAVHEKVYGFLLGLQELSTKRDTSPHVSPVRAASVLCLSAMPSTIHPRTEANIDHCTCEVIGKLVEFYRSEVLLSKSNSFKMSQIPKSTSLCSAVPSKMDIITAAGVACPSVVPVTNNNLVMEISNSEDGSFSERPVLASHFDAPDFALNLPASLTRRETDIFEEGFLNSLTLSMLCDSPSSLCLSDLSASPTFSGQDTPAFSAGVNGQQTDVPGLSMKHSDTPVTASKMVASALVRETMDTHSSSGQKGLSHYSSTSPVNNPVHVKRRHLGFRFIPEKVRTICVRWKKSNKVNPACLVPDDHTLCSSSGHVQESSHLEPRVKTSSSLRERGRKLLSRMCSAISNALPNPCKCMARRPS